MVTGKKLLLGLSIDEYIQWAIAETSGRDVSVLETHSRPTLDGVELRDQIEDALGSISSWVLNEADGIGVSTYGVVNGVEGRLTNLVRKKWRREEPSYIIDFRSLLTEYVSSGRGVADRLVVQNDATAAAFAEYTYLQRVTSERCDRLFYITLNEGVNGGIIQFGRPLTRRYHPEMGHIRPALHFSDPAHDIGNSFEAQTGCPAHRFCFEGVASGARIRKSWGGPNAPSTFSLIDLAADHIGWQLEAFYVAQLCLIGALTLSPDRIVIGGPMMNDRLLPLIRTEFEKLDAGYYLPAYIANQNLIQAGNLGRDVNLRGALELARLAAIGQQDSPVHLV